MFKYGTSAERKGKIINDFFISKIIQREKPETELLWPEGGRN